MLGKAGEKWLESGCGRAAPRSGDGENRPTQARQVTSVADTNQQAFPRTVVATPSERSITPASYHRALRSPYLGIAGKGARAGPNEPGALRTNRAADARGNARSRADIIACRRKACGGGSQSRSYLFHKTSIFGWDLCFNGLEAMSPTRKYPCEICPNSFARHEHLARHMATHTDEKPFKCPVCNKGFARK